MSNNPVVERMAAMAAHWRDFLSQDRAPLMRWLCSEDELQLVRAFVAAEGSEAAQTASLILPVVSPFQVATDHAAVVHQELLSGLSEAREVGELHADLTDPEGLPAPGGVEALLSLCEVVRSRLGGQAPAVGLFLLPRHIEDGEAWSSWLGELVAACERPTVRIVVVDRVDAPGLESWAQAAGERVYTRAIDGDVPALVRALAAKSPPGPASDFRLCFIDLQAALGAGDLAAAGLRARDALAVAGAQGWTTMAFVVHAAMGAALLSSAPEAALRAWDAALAAAGACLDEGQPVAGALHVQALMGRAGAQGFVSHHEAAAQDYLAAMVYARAAQNHVLTVECLRMAGHSLAQAGSPIGAWRCGLMALSHHVALPPELRETVPLDLLLADLRVWSAAVPPDLPHPTGGDRVL